MTEPRTAPPMATRTALVVDDHPITHLGCGRLLADLAEPAGGDEVAGVGEGGHAPVGVAEGGDLAPLARGAGGLDHALRLGRVVRERLLAQHVLAGLERGAEQYGTDPESGLLDYDAVAAKEAAPSEKASVSVGRTRILVSSG